MEKEKNQEEEIKEDFTKREIDTDSKDYLKTRKGNDKKLSKIKITALFALGFFIGIMFKSQALKSFAVGYDDYKISQYKSDYPVMKKEKVNVPSNSNESKATSSELENQDFNESN
jgi:hypothetical protein